MSSAQTSESGLVCETRPATGMGGGSAPLGEWEALQEPYERYEAPIFIELYQAPLTPAWVDSRIKRTQRWQSVRNLSLRSISAAVVRPGPRYDPKKLYMVTLHNDINYSGSTILTLQLGVYPDLSRFSFNDVTASVLIHRATPGYIPEDNESYYDVGSFYRRYSREE